MKKYLLLSLSLFLVLALGACKGEPEEECVNHQEDGQVYNLDQDNKKPVSITVWLDNEDYAEALIEAFETANPEITVNYEQMGSVDTRAALELRGPSGTGADVVVFPHDHIGKALQSGLLFNLPENLKTTIDTRHIASAVGTATTCYDLNNNETVDCNGSNEYLFGVPLSGESVALFYNKTLLNQLVTDGVLTSAEPAATFEEMLTVAETYNDFTDINDLKLFFSFDVGNAYDMHFAATAHGFELFGADHLDKSLVNLNSQPMVDALTWLQDVRAVLDLGSGTLSGEANRTLFENGKLPYIIDGPWSIERYTEADAGFEFGITKIPTIGGVQPVTFSGVQMAAVYRGTSQPAAALKFLEFMQSDEGLAILYDVTGKLPTLKDVSAIPGVSDDVYLQGIQEQLAFSHPMPIIPEMGAFWTVSGGMYSASWNQTSTPQEAADEAQNGYLGLVTLGN